MAERSESLPAPVPFDAWVNDNNPPTELEYGKGFWDYVETVRRLVDKLEGTNAHVIGTYIVRTPPPEEELPMPALTFDVGPVGVALNFDFGAGSNWPKEWTVSVKRSSPYLGPVFGLFDEAASVTGSRLAGLGDDWSLPSFRESPAAFTCQLEDEWDVAMLLRIVTHEA